MKKSEVVATIRKLEAKNEFVKADILRKKLKAAEEVMEEEKLFKEDEPLELEDEIVPEENEDINLEIEDTDEAGDTEDFELEIQDDEIPVEEIEEGVEADSCDYKAMSRFFDRMSQKKSVKAVKTQEEIDKELSGAKSMVRTKLIKLFTNKNRIKTNFKPLKILFDSLKLQIPDPQRMTDVKKFLAIMEELFKVAGIGESKFETEPVAPKSSLPNKPFNLK